MTKTQKKVFKEILGEFQELSMNLKAEEVSLKYQPNVGWFVSFINDTNHLEIFLGVNADDIIPDNLNKVAYYYVRSVMGI